MEQEVGSFENRVEEIILNSEFKEQYVLYLNTASDAEKIAIKQKYIDLISCGSEYWNKWAESLGRFIKENKLDPYDFIIDLSRITVHHYNFRNLIFPVSVSFINTVFASENGQYFSECTFKGNTIFSKTLFPSGALFNRSNFENSVRFDEVVFSKFVDFRGCTFKDYTIFYKTKFQEASDFVDCRFEGRSDFNCIHFGGYCSFYRVDFSEAIFIGSTFNNDARFDHSIFQREADFSDVSFEGVCTFDHAKFISSVPDFNYAKFKQPPFLSKVVIPKPTRIGDGSDTEKYRKLKSLAITSNDHEMELLFFSYEMKSKMLEANSMLATRVYTPLRMYEVTSNFGRSISKPFVCLMIVMLLSVILHYVIIPPTSECRGNSEYSKEIAVLSYSASHSLPLFLSDRSAQKATNDCLFGEDKPPSFLVQTIGFLQSLLSAVFAFLIGLGVRNRFKIK